MTLELWTLEITPDQLAACVQAVAASAPVGGLDVVEIEWWNRPVAMFNFSAGLTELQQSPADSPRGSVFGPQIEIRWRRMNEKIRVAVFADLPLPNLGKEQGAFTWKTIPPASTGWDGKSQRERSLLLWGSEEEPDGSWSELRIGRPLTYPVKSQQMGEVNVVELKIVEYLNAAGQVILTRRTGLQARRARTQPKDARKVDHA